MPRSIDRHSALTSGTWRPLLSLAALIVICPLQSLQLRAQQGALAGVKVLPENLIFVGNKAFSAEDLRAIFRSAGTMTAQLPPQFIDTYNNDRIVHATNMLLAFYRNRGFVRVVMAPPEMDFVPGESGKMTLILRITENRSYRLGKITLTGATVLREAVVVSMLNLQTGSPVNLSKISAGVQALRETYLTLGYLDTGIKTSLDAPDNRTTANLNVDIQEGRQYHVGRVELVGNSPIQEKLLRETLPFQPGDIFGRKAFDACLETLNELGITPMLTINDVDFRYDQPKALVDVVIHLEGKKR